MSTSMGPADGSEVAPEARQATHINVHIHQESGVAKLLQAVYSLLRLPDPAPGTTRTLGSSRPLVASWVVQIVLGVLSGVLGGLLYIPNDYYMHRSGAAIWTGVVAVLAGAAAFLYEKRGGICWALLRILLALAAFSTAIAAIVIGARNFHSYYYYSSDALCQMSSKNGWPTRPPTTPSPEEVERQHLCMSYLTMIEALITSLHAMLMGVWVLLLLASLVPLCLYFWRRFFSREKRDKTLLLEANGTQPHLS